jgi:dTDP-4-amino-4,6-dideoxygalactose transaminase
VFCEVDADTKMIDMDDVEAPITDRNTAIEPDHYAGIAANMERLAELVEGRNIAIIEDAAQGLDSSLHGAALGTIGRFGCLSFHHTKNLHAGLAGALIVNESGDIDRATWVWERGTNRQQYVDGRVDKYTWVALGSSFYPTELQAAVLLAQLEHIDENTAHRRRLYEVYSDELEELSARGIARPLKIGPGRVGNGHAFSLLFETHEMREAVRQRLNADGIQAQFHYVPLHSSPMGQAMGYRAEDLPITEHVAACSLRLPLHFDMSVDDARRVAERVLAATGVKVS